MGTLYPVPGWESPSAGAPYKPLPDCLCERGGSWTGHGLGSHSTSSQGLAPHSFPWLGQGGQSRWGTGWEV